MYIQSPPVQTLAFILTKLTWAASAVMLPNSEVGTATRPLHCTAATPFVLMF